MSITAPATARSLLRFLTAGSVDDGKSTLIGRLLHDSGGLYEDELAALDKRSSVNGKKFDPSHVTDGLKAEREQGITIDVAYRYFATPRRKFIIADTPGHEQYTRNMITGASTAHVAVLLIDARKGLLLQTRRHVYIAWLLGLKSIIVALNKMDLVGFDREVFAKIRKDFLEFAAPLQFQEIQFIPMSALEGDNVISRSDQMPWYEGWPLLETLESIETHDDRGSKSFRFPVQTVIRSDQDFRGYAGQIASGTVEPDNEVLALPSGRRVTIDRLLNYTQDLLQAFAPMSVVISLKEHIDLGRGDMLCDPLHLPSQSKHFRATLIWMSATSMQVNEPYLIKHTTQNACMNVMKLLHKIDLNTLSKQAADTLHCNEIGEVEVETHKAIFCDPYTVNKTTGNFIVVHPVSNVTLAAGIISLPLLPEAEGPKVSPPLNGRARENQGLIVWITGLSGSGKTTICSAVHTELLARGIRVEVLDGDIVRKHLSRDLRFSKAERDENIRRIGFVAHLLMRNGVVVLVSAISPYRAVRDEIRENMGGFLEVFVNAPLELCERRDPKGLYKRARAGELRGFTGIDDPYEPPLSPEVECRTDREGEKESVEKVLAAILRTIHRNEAR
ncbi:MAG TPA: adenylyl-sulfate kinase [Candidatus Angelobacter sp.]